MANNTGAIKAGRAYVEIYGDKSPLTKALKSAGQSVAAWGSSIAKVGTVVAAGTAAISLPVIAAAKSFSDFGSALNDAAARTGASVENLSMLKYAAEQTGASFEDVEKGFKMLAKSGKFAGMSADDAFRAALDQIAAISDPTEKARVAMDLFGKSGANLVPMANDMKSLEASARGLGVVMSTEAATAADALGDAWGDLMAASQAMGNSLMADIAPALTEAIELMVDFASVIAKGGILEGAKLLWSGLSAVWAEGIAFVANNTKEGFKTAASFMIDVFSTIQGAWVEVTEFMATAWNKTTNKIASGIIEIMGWFDKTLDVADAQANLDEDTANRQAEFDKRRADRLKAIEDSAANMKTVASEGIDSFAGTAAEQAMAEMEKFKRTIGDVRSQRKGGEKVKETIGGVTPFDKVSSVGTFSGSLAGGLGAGNRLDEIATASKATAANTKKIASGKGGIPVK